MRKIRTIAAAVLAVVMTTTTGSAGTAEAWTVGYGVRLTPNYMYDVTLNGCAVSLSLGQIFGLQFGKIVSREPEYGECLNLEVYVAGGANHGWAPGYGFSGQRQWAEYPFPPGTTIQDDFWAPLSPIHFIVWTQSQYGLLCIYDLVYNNQGYLEWGGAEYHSGYGVCPPPVWV